MEKMAGRFEKRFILESLLSEKAALILRSGGGKYRARLSAVTADEFSLDIDAELSTGFDPASRRPSTSYILDIGFRGLVFRSLGNIVAKVACALRISMRDPWILLSTPSQAASFCPPLPSLSMAIDGRRIDIRWPERFIPPSSQGLSLSASALSLLASALGAEVRFRGVLPNGASSVLERVLHSSGKRALVLDSPLGMPESGSKLFMGFPFLGLSEFESLSVLEGGTPEDLPEPGIHAPVFSGADCLGFIHYRQSGASLPALRSVDLFRLFMFEALSGRAFEEPRGDEDILCLSLQVDGLLIFTPLHAESPLTEKGARIRLLLSFPGRDISLLARVAAAVPDEKGRLTFLDFDSGRPEDFRFLFETLYACPFDGESADYLMKKAAS
jgi:hypothetical protein